MISSYHLIAGSIALFGGFFFGAIPFGFIVAKLRGVDIQQVGSGNIGFSNVFRSVGGWEGIVVLIADIGKGLIPVIMLRHFYGLHFGLIAGLAAMLGHMFTPFLRFKGGKGVATGLGVFIGLAPFSALFTFLVWLLVVGVSRYISLSSIIAAIALPVLIYFSRFLVRDEYDIVVEVFTILVCLLVIVMHRSNIKRLMRGTERRFTVRKKQQGIGKENR